MADRSAATRRGVLAHVGGGLLGATLLGGCAERSRSSTPALEPRDALVTEVIDGDTLDVRLSGGTETVRLLGVDTPEPRGDVSPAEFPGVTDTDAGRAWLRTWAERASRFAVDRLAGRRVEVATDPMADRRGGYGRLLAYVIVDRAVFNRSLLEDGYARLYDTRFTRRDVFASAARDARTDGRGLWGFDERE